MGAAQIKGCPSYRIEPLDVRRGVRTGRRREQRLVSLFCAGHGVRSVIGNGESSDEPIVFRKRELHSPTGTGSEGDHYPAIDCRDLRIDIVKSFYV